jgi:hypothetical protein
LKDHKSALVALGTYRSNFCYVVIWRTTATYNSPESFYNGIARFFMEVISCDCWFYLFFIQNTPQLGKLICMLSL